MKYIALRKRKGTYYVLPKDRYVVGISTCYPQPGSIKINNKENLTIVSKYDPSQNHIGGYVSLSYYA